MNKIYRYYKLKKKPCCVISVELSYQQAQTSEVYFFETLNPKTKY